MSDLNLCLTCSIEQVKKWDENLVIEKINNNFGYLKNWVFQESERAEAKRKVADLRRIQKEINNFRISVGKEWDKPLILFKEKVDRVLETLNDTIITIDSQLKIFEEKEKNQKKEMIVELWNKIGLTEYSIDSIQNPKWTNKTYGITEIEKDMKEIKDRINQARDLILSEVKDETLSYILKKEMETNLCDSNLISRLIVKKNEYLTEKKAQKIETPEIKINLQDPVIEVMIRVRGRKSELLKIKNFISSCDVEVIK